MDISLLLETINNLNSKFMIILNERPKGMPYDKYKALLKQQKELIKNRSKLVYLAHEVLDFDKDEHKKYDPFKGSVKQLKFI